MAAKEKPSRLITDHDVKESNKIEKRTWVQITFRAVIFTICTLAILGVTAFSLPKRQLHTNNIEFAIQQSASFDSVRKYREVNRNSHHIISKGTSGGLFRRSTTDTLWQGRLPMSVIPSRYNLTITPYFYPEDVPAGRQRFTFDGSVSIAIQCKESTNQITLHTSTINILELSVFNIQTNGVNLAERYEEDNSFDFLKIDLTENLIVDSEYVIHIEYVGVFQEEPIGFYRVSFRTEYGETRLGGVTHMQPTSARKVTPCFDEPSFKAEFDVTIRHRSDMTALSNGIEHSVTHFRGNRGLWKETAFKTTPKMSTYLLAFAVTHYVSTSKTTESGTVVRVWSDPQQIRFMRHALESAVKQTTYFESYFNYSYPLEKQDIVAVPYLLVLAMENWGLIFCQEDGMRYNPEEHSLNQKEVVAMLMSHELGHQWIGNLVTPEWWSDLWLNEGFARYMEYLGIDHCEPTWKTRSELFLEYEQRTVLRLDSTSESHPLHQDVDTPEQIFSLFDVITYEKGATIIRMLEDMLTEEVFIAGLQDYLKVHAYGNTNTGDLWESMTKADKDHGGNDVKVIMDTWTLQPFYPLVTFSRTINDTISASQKVFLSDDKAKEKFDELRPTYGNITWEILLSHTYQSEVNFTQPARDWMHGEEMIELTLSGDVQPTDWYLVNIGRYGYYRVNYDAKNWNRLSKQLQRNHEAIPVQNRFQLLDDAFVLFETDELGIHSVLKLTLYLHQELEYLPWRAATFIAETLRRLLKSQPSYGLFQKYWLQKLLPVYRHLGWESNRRNENPKTLMHRVQTIEAACLFQHEDCLQTAKDLYADYMADPANNPIPETSELRKFVYCFAIMHGSQREWDFGMQQFFNQLNYHWYVNTDWIYGLSCSNQSSLLNRLLEDAYYRRLYMPVDTVLGYIASHDIGLPVAWEFVQLYWDSMWNAYNDDDFFSRVLESTASHFTTEVHLQQLLEFGETRNFESGSSVAKTYQRAVDKATLAIEMRARYSDEVSQWMSQQMSQPISNPFRGGTQHAHSTPSPPKKQAKRKERKRKRKGRKRNRQTRKPL